MTEWYETAQPGDDFRDAHGVWFRVVCSSDEHHDLCAVELDGIDEGYEVTLFTEAMLANCTPDHIGNMRRKVAAVLLGMHIDATADLYGYEIWRRPDGWCLNGCYEPLSLDEVTEALILADWQPPGGGA